ncbi:MAG: ATP-binding protein, partial [Microcoleus sp.]
QFLKALYGDRLITFNLEAHYWECDLAQVKAAALTDNVVEFMAVQLQKLPVETQEMLKLAACIGNSFDLTTLAIVSEKSPVDVAANLWKALQSGLILPISETYKFFQSKDSQDTYAKKDIAVPYKFLHDRVQQAAYSLIPEDFKRKTHLKIGQLLLQNISKSEREERIFEILNQLNVGVELVVEPDQRNQLAQLNLIAGQKARTANAYAASFEYLTVGISLLASDSWIQSYDLALRLHESAAEAAYLSSNFEAMEQLVKVVLQQAKTLLDKVKIYDVRIQGYGAQNELRKALDTALEILQVLGVSFPEIPGEIDIQQTLAETMSLWTGQSPSSLIDLPEMVTPETIAAMQVLSSVILIAYQVCPELFVLGVLKQVSLSLQNGNTDLSAHAYACYGCILCSMVGEIEAGFQFGELSLTLLERLKSKDLKAKSLYVVSAIVTHWKKFIGSTLNPLLNAYTSALESGDLSHAAWAAYMYGYHSYFIGGELSELEQKMAAYSKQLDRIGQVSLMQMNDICRQATLNLMGMAENHLELRGNAYDEKIMLPLHQETNNHTLMCKYYMQKLILCYLFGDEVTALKVADLTNS